MVPNSLQTFLYDPETSKDMSFVEADGVYIFEEHGERIDEGEEIKRANWVERLMEIRSHWSKRQLMKENREVDAETDQDEARECGEGDDDGTCGVVYSSDEENEEVEYNRESFSKLLVKLVTSSIEKKAEAATIKVKLEQDSTRVPVQAKTPEDSESDKDDQKYRISTAIAYDIAASAASYVQSRAKDLFSLGHEEDMLEDGRLDPGSGDEQTDEHRRNSSRVYKSEVAAKMAAETVTAMVAAGERSNMRRLRTCSHCTQPHVNGSSTMTQTHTLDISSFRDQIHWLRGRRIFSSSPQNSRKSKGTFIGEFYEAAKGIYNQFLPEIISHMVKYGVLAKFQLAGHSLGGSLALLVNLLLLTRKVVRLHHLLPVVMFGSPFILCGGENVLNQLGLNENIIHSVIMHRDIVPQAFSCSYPGQVAALLKRLNGSFRSHPCLNKNKLLYFPLAKLFILQPDEKTSPSHPLIPPGSAFYALDKNKCGFSPKAVRAFIDRPHPIVTLSDPTSYGSEGTILRGHDSSNYLRAVNGVLREQRKSNVILRRSRQMSSNQLWPLLIAVPAFLEPRE